MTTDSEQRVRALLETAAPEPPHPSDGAEIRRRAEDGSGVVVPLRRTSRSTTLSVVLAAAAVIVVALAVVGLVLRSGNGKTAPPSGGHAPTHSGAPLPAAGPARCTNNATVFAGGRFVGPAGGDGTMTLTAHNRGQHACTFRDLPSIRLTVANAVVSRLAASTYRPSHPVVIGPRSSVRVVVALHAGGSCAVLSQFTTRITFTTDGFGYGFNLHVDGCGYTLASARLRR